MIDRMGAALTNLQVKYHAATLRERMQLRPQVEKLVDDYNGYQLRLLDDGLVATDADLAEMEELKKAIDSAAHKQELLEATASVAAFIAKRMV